MGKVSTVEEYKQVSNFQALRQTLLEDKYVDRLDKPLAYWALPGDRRLPIAFLGHTLRNLLDTPFEELAAAPGVGQKKINTMLKLLARATKDQPPGAAFPPADFMADRKLPSEDRLPRVHAPFNPATVSEALWDQWRETVRRHGVGVEKLGRLAPTLQDLPTVIWDTPLSKYLDYSVAQIRHLKTYGVKRVRAVLQVFHAVHEVLAYSQVESHLTVRLAPKFVVPVERWIASWLTANDGPSKSSVRESLAIPLVEQIHTDCGQTIGRIVEGRFGIQTAPQSVRLQAKRLGVTRARVYQLLEQCEDAMNVRWPEGRAQLFLLRKKLESFRPAPEGLDLLRTVVNTIFPDDEEAARRRHDRVSGNHSG